MIRLFAAIGLPAATRERLSPLASGLAGARWVPPENLHVTLRFLGGVPEDRVGDLAAAFDVLRAPPFPVTLRGTGHFGSGRRIRSVWVGVERTPGLVALQAKVERAAVACGHEPERRKFAPHVTVARLGRAPAGHVRAWLEASGGFAESPFDVSAFTLYESRPGRSGPAYLPLAEFPLARP